MDNWRMTLRIKGIERRTLDIELCGELALERGYGFAVRQNGLTLRRLMLYIYIYIYIYIWSTHS